MSEAKVTLMRFSRHTKRLRVSRSRDRRGLGLRSRHQKAGCPDCSPCRARDLSDRVTLQVAGGLMSYGSDNFGGHYRLAGVHTGRISQGRKSCRIAKVGAGNQV